MLSLSIHIATFLTFLACLILETMHKRAMKNNKLRAFCNLSQINTSQDSIRFCQLHYDACSDQFATITPGLFPTAVLTTHLHCI